MDLDFATAITFAGLIFAFILVLPFCLLAIERLRKVPPDA